MPDVTVGHGEVVGSYPSGDGRTINIWNFNVIVDGQAGICTYEALSTTSEAGVAQEVFGFLSEGEPVGGISENDGADNAGDFPDDQGQDDGLGDDDGGDTAVAGNEGGGFGESV